MKRREFLVASSVLGGAVVGCQQPIRSADGQTAEKPAPRINPIAVSTYSYWRYHKDKRLTIDTTQVRRVGDRYIPWLITVETPRQRSVTRVITEDYELRAKIPDKLFNTWNLAAGDAKSDRSKTEAVAVAEEESAAEVAVEVGE